MYCVNCGRLLGICAYYRKTTKCISCSRIGKTHSPSARKNMSLNHADFKGENHPLYGKTPSLETRNKIRLGNQRKQYSLETIKRLRAARTGCKNPMWRGGLSIKLYDYKFNNSYKEMIRLRDGYKCQLCGCSQIENIRKLAIHHIDYIKTNTVPTNNISLCRNCHPKTNINRKEWTKYFNVKIKEMCNGSLTKNFK